MKYLAAHPSMIDFGAIYRGSHVAGSFQIIGAKTLKSMKCFAEPGDMRAATEVLPDWLELTEPWETGQNRMGWQFRLKTVSVGFREASLRFELDEGTSGVVIRSTIKAGTPRLGDLVICNPAFECHTDLSSVQSLTRLLQGLDLRVHHVDSLAARFPRQPRTILLHGTGLIGAARSYLKRVIKFVDGGTNLILLADKFFRGTAEAANRIAEKYGMRLRDGDEPTFSSGEQAERATHRYSNVSQIRNHPLTKGIRRIAWHRPWPIDCDSRGVIPLITDAEDAKLCYVAVAKPKGYVAVLGKSLWHSMTSVGWPFDNDRLLANLFAGGDAEKPRTVR